MTFLTLQKEQGLPTQYGLLCGINKPLLVMA